MADKEKSQISDRMKGYEHASRYFLDRKVPVLIRVDGKAFHTYTKGAKRPFDQGLIMAMDNTAKELLKECQNAVMAYVQSDEISLLLLDDAQDSTDAWFGNNVQKIASVAASTATVEFASTLFGTTQRAMYGRKAKFDARCWNHPKDDVPNYFFWRMLDCRRNAINMVAMEMFSHKSLLNLGTSDRLKMIEENSVDYKMDYDVRQRLGGLYLRMNPATNMMINDFNYDWIKSLYERNNG